MKRFLALIMAGAVMLCAAGCSDKGTTGGKTALKIGAPNGGELTPGEIIDGFIAANPDIEVEVDETPWSDFKTKLKMQIAGGNAPDVFLTDSGYTATLGGMGAAVDLKDLIDKDLNRDDFTSALDIMHDGEGHVWGVTHSLSSAAVLYNKTLFDENGVEYPSEDWTFQDMIDIAKKLTKDTDGDGNNDIYGLATGENMTTGWLPFMLATGGAPLDETQTKSLFADKKSIDGLEKYKQTVVDMKISPDHAWITANGNSNSAFYSGKVGMLICLLSSTNTINQNAPEGFEYDAQMMPVGWDGGRNCIYVPNQWVIYAKSKEASKNAAWEWIKYFLSEKSQASVAESFTSIGIPVRKSALNEIDKFDVVPKNKGAFYKGLDDYGVTLFECPSWEEWKPKAEQAFMEMQSGAIGVKEAATRVDEAVKELLAK